MKTPSLSLLLAILLSAHSLAQRTFPTHSKVGLSYERCNDGWIALFDGKTLFGWRATSSANWKVKDGTIQVDAGEPGFLNTTTPFADYELQLEYSCPISTNSGVFVRSLVQPTDPSSDCYEINIAPADNAFPTGSIVARQKTRMILPKNDREWHLLKIIANGTHISVCLDGVETASFEDDQRLGRGHIGLQFREGRIAFRDIRLKPIGLESIFNCKDLAGWTDENRNNSQFLVEEGVLRVLNGRGQLETTDTYSDFVLQLECKTHAAGLNSGIFFRCIPGDQLMGYESQIQNAASDEDHTQPADCGTGGIFRRQDARHIVATDLRWFHKTIIANGAHIATWVNGHQVVDWTDDRPLHENPRKGRRQKAGSIMIQGHDPTTDLSFRNIRISETPKR